MTLPIVITLAILGYVAAAHLAGRRRRVPTSDVSPQLRQWSRTVAARIPEAVHRAQLKTVASKETREPIRMQSVGPVGDVGWSWRVQTPGGATVADMRAALPSIESAVNRPTPLVAVLDLQPHPTHEGWGTLRGYRRDPVHRVRSIAEVCQPGQRLMASPHDRMLVGVTRWAEHVRLPLFEHSMAVYGQTRSGKSSAAKVVLANLMPLIADGTARVRFVDVSVKQGRGYHWLRGDGWLHSWATTPKEASASMQSMAADLAERAQDGSDVSVRITRRMPLDVLLVEEGPAFLATKGAADELTQLVRQVGALGGVVVFVSQGAVEVPVTLRRQLRTQVAFRLADHTESQNALGSGVSERGPHTIPPTEGQGGSVDWRGVSYVDDDGVGARMVRWWWVDDAWLQAHGRALR